MRIVQMQDQHRRARGAAVALVVAFLFLGYAVYRAQVVVDTAYALQSEGNQLRPVTLRAARGPVLDRGGRVLATDTVGRALLLLPPDRASLADALARLAPVVGLEPDAVAAALERYRRAPDRPVLVADGLSPAQVAAVEAGRDIVPEALVVPSPQRVYPAGAAMVEVVGRATDGKRSTGAEARYRARLAGTPGLVYVEVDAGGRIVSGQERRPRVAPVEGRPLRLTLDAALQGRVAGLWPAGIGGTLVALEPETGDVLALYGPPGGGDGSIAGPVEGALGRLYGPGDVWKPVTAAIALELDVVDPAAHLMIPCRGGMRYGERYFRCWDELGHGFLDMASAIARSCDVYFYQLGLKIGLERLLEHGSRLGFGAAAGLGWPGERPGVFPDSPAWLARRSGRDPDETAVLSLAAGRGPIRQSPLHMARFYGALVTDGRARPPRLVADSTEPAAAPYLTLAAERLAALRTGLERVTGPGGAAPLAGPKPWSWAGAAAPSGSTPGGESWFIGAAGPRQGSAGIVVATVLESGDVATAARLAAEAADYYLRSKNGMSIDSIQSVGEHRDAGGPAPRGSSR